MGFLGDILSTPFKVAGAITEAVGDVTGTEKLTNIVSKPLDAAGKAIEEVDE